MLNWQPSSHTLGHPVPHSWLMSTRRQSIAIMLTWAPQLVDESVQEVGRQLQGVYLLEQIIPHAHTCINLRPWLPCSHAACGQQCHDFRPVSSGAGDAEFLSRSWRAMLVSRCSMRL